MTLSNRVKTLEDALENVSHMFVALIDNVVSKHEAAENSQLLRMHEKALAEIVNLVQGAAGADNSPQEQLPAQTNSSGAECNTGSLPDVSSQRDMQDMLHIPDVPLPQSLSPPSSYSHLESNFVRHLQRASLERAFLLAASHHRERSHPSCPLRFSEFYLGTDQICSGIQELLSMPAWDSLDNHSAPFLTVGGSGTHFARQDLPSIILLTPELWIRKSSLRHQIYPVLPMDPQLWVDRASLESALPLMELDGEWLDSNDVGCYLQDCIRHPPPNQFNEVAIEGTKSPEYVLLPTLNFSSLKLVGRLNRDASIDMTRLVDCKNK